MSQTTSERPIGMKALELINLLSSITAMDERRSDEWRVLVHDMRLRMDEICERITRWAE